APRARPAPAASAPPAASPAPKPAISADQQASMRNALSNVLGRLGQPQAQQQDAAPSLSDVVDPDAIVNSGLFDQPKVVEVPFHSPLPPHASIFYISFTGSFVVPSRGH